jgi:hypothetical protein
VGVLVGGGVAHSEPIVEQESDDSTRAASSTTARRSLGRDGNFDGMGLPSWNMDFHGSPPNHAGAALQLIFAPGTRYRGMRSS